MKTLLFFLTAAICAGPLMADVTLYVDAAPNAYGASDYDAWLATAYANAAAGTFVNMENSVNSDNVGTTNFDIEDEVVYSFGDLGSRLTWVYYIDGETVDSLTGNFKISLTNTWDGVTSDFYKDYYGSTWLEPTKWIDYDADGDGTTDGVIGTAGMAWWGAYGVDTQEALDADITSWATADESWTFTAQLYGDEETSITSNRTAIQTVPAPGALLLTGIGITLVSRLRRRKQL